MGEGVGGGGVPLREGGEGGRGGREGGRGEGGREGRGDVASLASLLRSECLQVSVEVSRDPPVWTHQQL